MLHLDGGVGNVSVHVIAIETCVAVALWIAHNCSDNPRASSISMVGKLEMVESVRL